MKTEQRSFEMHPHLLFDIIKRQSGTLEQAIREGIMNSVDAQAKEINITVGKSSIHISDDGTGFRNKQEIETYFETFGQPHDQNEKKVFGAFRMGRGQLFAYGSNQWRSGPFQMDVNIRDYGLHYDLVEYPEVHKGCEISLYLYTELSSYDVTRLIESLARSVKWLSTLVFVNDNRISVDPSEMPDGYWTHVLDEAYVKLEDCDQSSYAQTIFYNLGVFVKTQAGKYQKSATVVSRQPMELTFSRSDIMSNCPVLAKVSPLVFVPRQQIKAKSKGQGITEADKDAMAEKFVAGDLSYDKVRTVRLIRDVTGHHWSFQMLKKRQEEFGRILTSAVLKSHRATDLFKSKLAFVVASSTLRRFQCKTADELAEILKNNGVCRFTGREFEEFYREAYVKVQIIPEAEYTGLQAAVAHIVNDYEGHLRSKIPVTNFAKRQKRKILLGNSPGPKHWTDGVSYIGLDWSWIKGVGLTVCGWLQICQAITHEYCHDDNSLGEHIHDGKFYETYYGSQEGMFLYATTCFKGFPYYAQAHGVEITKMPVVETEAQLVQNNDEAATNVMPGLVPLSEASIVPGSLEETL